MHIGLFFTFGLIFVLWVYMGVHGLTNSRWQEHMKIYLWIFIWVLLAAAITIWPDTQYIRAVVTGLPFTVGFYLNVATVHLTVWDVWSPVAAGALGFVPLFLGLLCEPPPHPLPLAATAPCLRFHLVYLRPSHRRRPWLCPIKIPLEQRS